MKRIAAALSAVTLTLGLAASTVAADANTARTAAPATAEAGYVPPPIQWQACTDPDLVEAGAKCGYLTVPVNYAKPNGKKIKIYLSRILHKSSAEDYLGVALTNPGGPGGSGVRLSRLGGWIPNGVGDRFDWIGFDPRGVGQSKPALTCSKTFPGGDDRPNYVPHRAADKRYWKTKTAKYAAACGRSYAAKIGLLNHLKTKDSVADMESIRKALGVKKISYYGFSYGTYLGQVYATKHPARVDRFVFDGNVNPHKVWYQANLGQNVAFDKNMDRYWKYLAKHPGAYKLGKDWRAIKRGYYALLKKLDRKAAYQGRLGPDELNDAMLGAGYYVYGWVETGQAYSKLARGKGGKAIYDMYGGGGIGDDNGYAIYNAVQCTDVQWPKRWARWERDAWRQHRQHPFLTWGNTWYNAPCLNWTAKAGTPTKVTGSKVKSKILLISETFDAATPYSGSLAVRRLFPTASLIEGVNGTTHSGSLSGVPCTDNTVARYLATGKVPKRLPGSTSDKKCKPVPAPQPGAALARPGIPAEDRAALLGNIPGL